MIQKRTIGLVGTGNVGVAAAYALFVRGLASRIVLVDRDRRRAEGEAMDLMHGQAFVGSVAVEDGDFPDLNEAQLVVISAGVGQKPGESRLDLLKRNAAVFDQIVGNLDRHCPEAVLVIASNPVDLLTYVTQRISRRSPARIIGTGTLLDTGRFRALLGRHYGVDPRSVHAYILGEHGDSEVPIWSSAAIGSTPLVGNAVRGISFDRQQMAALFEEVRNAAQAIIQRKGYTNLAIGSVIARIVEAVLDDEKSVLPVSVQLNGQYGISEVCLSVPAVIGIDGVESLLAPVLDADEMAGLKHSAAILKERLRELSLPAEA